MQENQPNSESDERRNPPRTVLTYHEVLELLPGFVLGALDPEEMLAVESYIDQQQALLDRVTELETATAHFAYVAPPVAPPAHIKSQLLQRAQADLATNQRSRGAPPLAFPPRKVIAPVQEMQSAPAHRRPTTTSRNWFGGVARGLMGFGVVAALVLLAFMTTQLRSTVGRLSAELDTARSELTQIQTVNQSLLEELRTKQIEVAVLTNPTSEKTLVSTEQPNATATFYTHNDIGMLVTNNLQPLPETQAYQLWLIGEDGVPQPAGLMQLTREETGLLLITIPATAREFVNVGVTIEPAEGSPTPTAPIILLG
jgi:anti-sigma-K factor RskA